MATSDAKKKAANIAAAQAAAARRAAMPDAATMLKYIDHAWKAAGWPESERSVAMGFGIEKLYLWLRDHIAEVDRIRTALCVEPVSEAIKLDIRLAKARAHDGDPDPRTPLDLARSYGLPLVVVLYIADGEPQPDTAVESPSKIGPINTRPWRFSGRNN